MNSRATAAKNIKLNNFEEVDEILSNFANLQPVVIAYSNRGIENIIAIHHIAKE